MPPHDKPEKTIDKVTIGFVDAALQARIFDVAGFEKPEAVADYCTAIAKRIIEADSDGG
jgi:hypothetical protein